MSDYEDAFGYMGSSTNSLFGGNPSASGYNPTSRIANSGVPGGGAVLPSFDNEGGDDEFGGVSGLPDVSSVPVTPWTPFRMLKRRRVLFRWDIIRLGIRYTVLAAVSNGFGNSLQPISPFAFAHSFFTLVGFHLFTKGFGRSLLGYMLTIATTIFIQSFGTLLGFYGLYENNVKPLFELLWLYCYACVNWSIITFIALLLQHAFMLAFPGSFFISLVYPAAHTTVMMVVLGYGFGTMTSLGGAVLDFAPLQYVGALFGLGGVNFVTVLAGTTGYLVWRRHDPPRTRDTVARNWIWLLALLVTTGFVMNADWLYQKKSGQVMPSYGRASCIAGTGISFSASSPSEEQTAIWSVTRDRGVAGDDIILWSEAALEVGSAVEESQLLEFGGNVTRDMGAAGSRSFVGVTYKKSEDGGKSFTSHLVLYNSSGSISWRYRKAYPSYMSEVSERPGKARLYFLDTNTPLGRVSGAIGSDLDYPHYIRQAGRSRADLFLDPSSSTQRATVRRLTMSAMRAVENGFSLLHCTDAGISGLASGSWLLNGRPIEAQKFTRYNSSAPYSHERLAVFDYTYLDDDRYSTFYAICGFAFDWIMLGFTILCGIFVFLNTDYLYDRSSWSWVSYFMRTWVLVEETAADPEVTEPGDVDLYTDFFKRKHRDGEAGADGDDQRQLEESAAAPPRESAWQSFVRFFLGPEYDLDDIDLV
jgi:predicted amidohydrolase